ncbi:MAG: PRC-barrel domain-containing protein [Gloeobacterales cyanobacterium]
MKKHLLAATLLSFAVIGPAFAQTAGKSTLGVSVTLLDQVYTGWSVQKEILGKEVTNDKGEKVGKIEDLIITPKDTVSYAIVGAGGFLGVGRNDVAIPVSQFKIEKGKILLPEATKAAIKAMPTFDYAKKQ